MTPLQELEQKIRQSIPFLKDEYEAFEDGSIDRDMITQIGLNHVLEYFGKYNHTDLVAIDSDGDFLAPFSEKLYFSGLNWNLKSAYLKDQSEGLITFLNELK